MESGGRGERESMAAIVSVNGRITDEAGAVVSVMDHGFLYGEGIYEAMRSYGRRLFLFDRHMDRLRRSAAMIHLSVPLSDPEIASRIAEATSVMERDVPRAASESETYVRILLTRGVGELNYNTDACPVSTVVIIVKPHAPHPAELFARGVKITIAPMIRNHPGSVNPAIKSNNLLNNVLAAQFARRDGAFEALLHNYRGELAECSRTNLFLVRNGEARTPPLDAGLLPGITRAIVLEIGAAAGVPTLEAVLRDEDLAAADEIFLTGTTTEIMPVVRVEDRIVGAGTPGPLTRRLMDEYRRRTALGG